MNPSLLVLDEPTAPLGAESVDLLFELRAGCRRDRAPSVVYITHRLAEVRELADRVTVLRDGRLRATAVVDEISDGELLALIVGRQLDSTFPPKHDASRERGDRTSCSSGLTGAGFNNVSLEAHRGEIIGIAGVVGNGQSELLRALAGLHHFEGSVTVNGTEMTAKSLLNLAAYLPADRLTEGLMMRLSVRENAAVSALKRFRTGPAHEPQARAGHGGRHPRLAVGEGGLPRRERLVAVGRQPAEGRWSPVRCCRSRRSCSPTSPPRASTSAHAPRSTRSCAMSRATGIPVVVASSDAKELEGLCDTVIVMSRGHVVDVLRGDELTEERMIGAAVSSTTQTVSIESTRDADSDDRSAVRRAKVRRFVQGDYAPAVLLIAVILALGAFIFLQNDRYLGAFNISSMLLLVSALGFIALGQTIALLTGGIDLSVGPLVGFLVVVGSFFILDEAPIASILFGFAAMLAVSIIVGLINGVLIRYVKFTADRRDPDRLHRAAGHELPRPPDAPPASSTPTSRARSRPSSARSRSPSSCSSSWSSVSSTRCAALRWGWRLRAAGSDEESARRVGVDVNRTVILGVRRTSVLTFLGAIMLMTQIGIGDPAQGVAYTLSSITAVVLGGTSLLGGRGTFVGTLLGSMLLVQVLNATVFLRLDQMWQYVLQGALILAAAIVYALVRSQRRRGVMRGAT